jgi:DNA sulfur modification protein DndB
LGGFIVKKKIPAIRAKMGIWVYYAATLSFEEISQLEPKNIKDLCKSNVLGDMLQRELTDNYKQISNYLLSQNERFFNSLVLAIYDGEPHWQEIALDYGNGEECYDIGFLELNGKEQIFPIDGQHRIQGIKDAITHNAELKSEKVPVIIVGHRNDDEGKERSRRLFSTLNRYAKPVNKRDIIALDEDDVVAIVTRNFIESNKLFGNERILDHKTKSMPSTECKAFTNIITLYDCNVELLKAFLALNREKRTVAEFIKHRPEDAAIDLFNDFCNDFWNSMAAYISDIKAYLGGEADARRFRNSEIGGNLLFRPMCLIAATKAVCKIKQSKELSFADVFQKINQMLSLQINDAMWLGAIWDKNNRKINSGNTDLIELLFLKNYDTQLLNSKEKKKLISLGTSLF